MNDTTGEVGAKREKYWKELTVEEKIERMRHIVKRQDDVIQRQDNIIGKLLVHEHGQNGMVYLKLHDSGNYYNQSGRLHSNLDKKPEKDEVFF